MNEPPAWLKDEPEIQALLHAVLDRFDRQSAEDRQRSISLPTERFLSSLVRSDASADQSWALVRELELNGVLTIRGAKRGPYDPEWAGAKLSFSAQSESVLRNWLRRERIELPSLVWLRAVQRLAHRFPHGVNALLARRIAIPRRSPEETINALASIGEVTGTFTLRQLSAFAFWGDSKVLDDRGDLIAALFPQLQVRDRAIIVSVHLPVTCNGVLFIENQDTYTAAVAGVPIEAHDSALIFAAGFRNSAARIRTRGGALLHYAGPGVSQLRELFDAWWFDTQQSFGPLWFWGDLDFAGMQILKSLKVRFRDVSAWQPGYAPMLARLRAFGGGHKPENSEAGQIDPIQTGCRFADDVLLPAVRMHGSLDQENLSP